MLNKSEHINEKFTEDSDPIADMNIGMMYQIKLWMKSVNEPFRNKDNALACSAGYGKLDFVEYLLAAGANVHASYDFALQWASDNGHTEVVKILLAAGANVHARDDGALRCASYYGHTEIVKLLLAAGADVHTYDDQALQSAYINGHTEVVKVLKDHITKEKYNKNKKINMKKINEDAMGGVSAPQSTSMNTPGMGNVSPAGVGKIGSGDKFGNTIGGKPYTQGGKVKTKRKKKVMNKKKIVKEDVNETFIDTATLITSITSLLVFTSILRISLKNAVKDHKIRNIVKRLAQQPKIREIVKTNNIYSKNKLRDIFAKYLTEDELQYLHEIDDIDVEIEADKIKEAAPRDFSKKNFGSKKHRHYFRHIDVDAKCIKCGKTREQIKQKVNENNLNPYDKLGVAMAKKLGIKPPFKKKKGSKNQNAMVQKKFEHQILTFDEFRNQLNENK